MHIYSISSWSFKKSHEFFIRNLFKRNQVEIKSMLALYGNLADFDWHSIFRQTETFRCKVLGLHDCYVLIFLFSRTSTSDLPSNGGDNVWEYLAKCIRKTRVWSVFICWMGCEDHLYRSLDRCSTCAYRLKLLLLSVCFITTESFSL